MPKVTQSLFVSLSHSFLLNSIIAKGNCLDEMLTLHKKFLMPKKYATDALEKAMQRKIPPIPKQEKVSNA